MTYSIFHLRGQQTATIANGASVSGAVDLSKTALMGFVAPAAWTTAALNLEVSLDGSTWVTAGVIGPDSGPVGSWSAVTAGAAYAVDVASMLPWAYVRFRSGTAASPVNQGGARIFTVITRPLS